MTPDDYAPLEHDSAREASSVIRGYDYQFWRTALAWIRLDEQSRLFVEGAEDYDLHQPTAVRPTAVRDRKEPITLGQASSIGILNHFWDHHKKNPDRNVLFRLITTQPVGHEATSVTASAEPGIVVWERLRSHESPHLISDEIDQLRMWLLARSTISSELRSFLANATPEECWRDLIWPFQWDTGAAETPAVIDDLHEEIVLFLASRGVDSSFAIATENAMLRRVVEVAKSENRSLTRASFFDLVDGVTRISIPAAYFNAFLQATQTSTQGSNLTVAAVLDDAPPLPAPYFGRNNVLGEMQAVLEAHEVFAVHASSGYGKSTIVASMLREVPDCAWVDLRGLLGQEQIARLDAVRAALIARQTLTHLVLDDFVFAGDASRYERRLRSIAEELSRRGGRLIVIAASSMPQRVARTLGEERVGHYLLPPFTTTEISDYLEDLGCPRDRLELLSALITLAFKGHPQLVDARVGDLQRQGFPLPTTSDVDPLGYSSVQDERRQARLLVANALTNDERELLYRLSVALQPLQRRTVLAIAEGFPGSAGPRTLPEPGNLLDVLAGPWLERLDGDRYRASPLIENIAQDVYDKQDQARAHLLNAVALIKLGTISEHDASAIIAHSMVAKNDQLLNELFNKLLELSDDVWINAASALFWFVLTPLFEEYDTNWLSRPVRITARMLQYRIAITLGQVAEAEAIVSMFDDEEPAVADDTPLARFFFFSNVIRESKPAHDIGVTLDYYLAWVNAAVALPPGMPFDVATMPGMEGPDGALDLVTTVGFMLAARINGADDLIELTTSIDSKDSDIARRLLWWGESDVSEAGSWLSLLVEREVAKEERDWRPLRDACRKFAALLLKIGLQSFYEAILAVAVRFTGSELNDLELAMAMVSEGLANRAAPQLLAARAELLYKSGEYVAALTDIDVALASWQIVGNDLSPSFACRTAALAAAGIFDLRRAAHYLEQGAMLLDHAISVDPSRTAYQSRLLVDAMWCYLADKETGSAVRVAVAAVRSLLNADEAIAEAAFDRVHFMLTAAAKLTFGVGAIGDVDIGWASAPGKHAKVMTYAGTAYRDVLAFDLVHLEALVADGDDCAQSFESLLTTSSEDLIRLRYSQLCLRNAIRLRPLAFVNELMRQQLPMASTQITPQVGIPNVLSLYIVAAMMFLRTRGADLESVLPFWLAGLADDPEFASQRSVIQGGLTLYTVPSAAIPPSALTPYLRAIIRERLCTASAGDELIETHRLWLDLLVRIPDFDFVIDGVASYIASRWLAMAEVESAPIAARKVALREANDATLQPWERVRSIISIVAQVHNGPTPEFMTLLSKISEVAASMC